jgi:uncharacterized protein with HEPN domain
MTKDDRVYLDHILERITLTEEFAQNNRDLFVSSRLIQEAVIRNFEVMGEATRRLSDELRQNHSDVPWQKIADMRNVLIHGYHRVSIDVIWRVIEDELPSLKQKVTSILVELDSLDSNDNPT